MSGSQSWFTKTKLRTSTSSNFEIVEFSHDIAHALDKGNQLDAILGSSVPHCNVAHSKLLHQLRAKLSNSAFFYRISRFLHYPSQCVSFDSSNLSAVKVSSGVPQGSVLGPLLLLFYLNDVPNYISAKIRLSSDDCVLYNVFNTNDDHISLNDSLDQFCRW